MTIRYIGSKKWLREHVDAMLPENLEMLISPFFGSGQIEYHVARRRPHVTVQGSDIFKPVVDFHRLLPVQSLLAFAGQHLEKEAVKQMVLDIAATDDLTSAVSAFVVLHYSFNGKFGTYVRKKPISVKTVNQISKLSLPNVTVAQRDCFEVLSSLPKDRRICVYLDPPYVIEYQHDRYYRGEKQGDIWTFQEKLAEAIKDASVPFILSINDSPEIRKLYAGYSIQQLRNPKTRSKTKYELLIHNLS